MENHVLHIIYIHITLKKNTFFVPENKGLRKDCEKGMDRGSYYLEDWGSYLEDWGFYLENWDYYLGNLGYYLENWSYYLEEGCVPRSSL